MSSRRTVAIIDDDPATLRALVRLLTSTCEVTMTPTADTLLNLLLAGRRFDAILSDLYMPVDGQALHAQVYRISPTQAARMIFITGGGLPERLEEFARTHIVLTKPLDDVEELLRMVELVAATHSRPSLT